MFNIEYKLSFFYYIIVLANIKIINNNFNVWIQAYDWTKYNIYIIF